MISAQQTEIREFGTLQPERGHVYKQCPLQGLQKCKLMSLNYSKMCCKKSPLLLWSVNSSQWYLMVMALCRLVGYLAQMRNFHH